MSDPHPTGTAGDNAATEGVDGRHDVAPASPSEPHGAGDHGSDGGHDDHGHAEERLGPIDWAAWGVGVASIAIGVLIAAGFAISTGRLAT